MRWLVIPLALIAAPAFADTLVAARTLAAGTVIQDEDVLIQPSDDPGGASLGEVLGMQTRAMIYEGRPIHPSRLIEPVLVARNQVIRLAYQTPLMRIEAEGRALEPGQAGQVIRVMNLSSRTTVSGRVEPDGTVIVQKK